ncbi:Na+/H+ antiporter subunit A [Paenibacillus sp. TRM 82003]|uniref:Na+/H+ antiporter subunit A n=1 Tax=Kineococcus sp. TRM81007 TaxID=2925831 RepID=UPI001F5A45B8|nr:Na+/H+ antiporter subunit A [Kineococcus sp. TRM81007]MCI2238318.1 Na+/H+ antiporter subunit A [Kineococcus sp. TRM81007]MCI3924010.1 Na+/H+ antiporter subunit A [Paenibacillus sp. TRM 82003]
MALLLIAHVAGALLAVPVVRRWGTRGVLLTALLPLAAVVWLARVWAVDGVSAVRTAELAWVPGLDLSVTLRLDALSGLLVLVVAAVGSLVLAYSAGYFADEEEAAARVRTVPALVGFAGAMLGLVLADDLVLLYVCWEVTTVLSWWLVGSGGRSGEARRAAVHALLVTTAGGLALLVGVVLLAVETGTTRISELLADPPEASAAVAVAAVLLLAGAITKSALLPVTAWLPGAMVAPTPVSAYLHAAAMVKAGVYLVARFTPVFEQVPLWRTAAIAVGATTMVVGAWRALRQHDLKLLLAHGTVSELGFMVVLLAAGGRTAALAGAALLLAHAMFKSALFMVAGAIDHSAGTRDVRELSGLSRSARPLLVISVLAAASMAGVPPTLGFIAHEAGFEAFAVHAGAADHVVLAVLVVGSVLTAAYSARFVLGAFGDRDGAEPTPWHRPGAALVLPAAAGALGSLVLGLFPGPVDALVSAVVADRPSEGGEPYHLALWHGLTPALAASAVALGGAALLVAARGPVLRAQERLAVPALRALPAGRVQDGALRGLDAVAARTTRAHQRGSLPQYVLVVAAALVAGPGTGLVLALSAGAWPTGWRAWDAPAQPLLAALCLASAVAAAALRNRRSAFLVVGVSGYALAGLFVVAGAPDLALTQALVETVTLAVALLVLRRLPARFEQAPGRRGRGPSRAVRVLAAAGAGVVAALLSAVALASRTAEPIADLVARLAVEEGDNVVNVILVDVRAWDTYGEITVLTAAATGVASLVFLRDRAGRAPALDESPGEDEARLASSWRGEEDLHPGPDSAPQRPWLTAAGTLPPGRRSAVLEAAVRLVFGVVMVLSVHLLLVGHDQPGGGFAGGLVAGIALFLRYAAGGRYELGEAARVDAGALLGLGLLIAGVTAVVPLFLGGQVLESASVDLHLPVLGTVHLVSSLAFDVGVYLVVVATVLDVLRSLGAGVDVSREREREHEAEEVS